MGISIIILCVISGVYFAMNYDEDEPFYELYKVGHLLLTLLVITFGIIVGVSLDEWFHL